MTISPDNIPDFTAPKNSGPDALTLLSLIREDISRAATPELTRQDDKAYVIVSSVSNGVYMNAVAVSKTGEYRLLDLDITTIGEIYALRQEQYNAKRQNKNLNESFIGTSGAKPEDDAWYSITFTVENDGFVSKTAYNYDKPVFTSEVPEEVILNEGAPVGEQQTVWTKEQYLEDLERYPRTSGTPEWLK